MEVRNLSVTLLSSVGGFLKYGRTQCSTEITFEKNEFYVGETANVRVICDNTACKKNVELIEF